MNFGEKDKVARKLEQVLSKHFPQLRLQDKKNHADTRLLRAVA